MKSCIVKNCKNYIKRKKRKLMIGNRRITFHSFPKNPSRRKEWATALGFLAQEIKSFHTVCSDHFPEQAFDRASLYCVRIRGDAIPNKFLRDIKIEPSEDVDPLGNSPISLEPERITDVKTTISVDIKNEPLEAEDHLVTSPTSLEPEKIQNEFENCGIVIPTIIKTGSSFGDFVNFNNHVPSNGFSDNQVLKTKIEPLNQTDEKLSPSRSEVEAALLVLEKYASTTNVSTTFLESLEKISYECRGNMQFFVQQKD